MANGTFGLPRPIHSPALSRWQPRFYPLILLLALLLYYYSTSLHLFYPFASSASASASAAAPQCAFGQARPDSLRKLPEEEKYMLYAPHSGFTNQVGELKNALLIAALLNRTLILPPVFHHHALWLGSCPKYRVQEPHRMRSLAWSHITQLIQNHRYVAIADIIDLSEILSSSLVKTIDLRIFSLLWCGVDITSACSGPVCGSLAHSISTWGTLESCGALLSTPKPVDQYCVYGVKDDCRTTVWTNNLKVRHAVRVQQPDQSLHQGPDQKKKTNPFKRRYKDILEALGPGSEAADATILSFGSLFSSEYKGEQLYVDMRESGDTKIDTLLHSIKLLPFTPDIINAGKLYVKKKFGHPFFCAQVRLLDGQFKNHWVKTFSVLKDQFEKVQSERQDSNEVLHVFLMTDLPRSNWTDTYLEELSADTSRYQVHIIDETESIIRDTSKSILKNEYGLKSGFLPGGITTEDFMLSELHPLFSPDILLFVEEVVCSCASLGFIGTSGSTIAENIVQLRNSNVCSSPVLELQ